MPALSCYRKKEEKRTKMQISTETRPVYKREGKNFTLSDDIIVEEKSNYLCLSLWRSGFMAFSMVVCETMIWDPENMIY